MRANGEVVDRVTDNYNTAILSRIYNLENYVKINFKLFIINILRLKSSLNLSVV